MWWLLGVAVFVIIFLVLSVRVVPEFQRVVIFRLGRVLRKPKGPGIVIIIPIIDKAVKVDLREFVLEIPQQTCITKDNAPILIDFLIYLKILDAVPSVVNVENFEYATRGLATTTLRAVVGDIILDDVLSKREEINLKLQSKLDEVTQRWGVKVTAVEIREILPPREVQDSMTKQMAAERTRRAMVTEAEGIKQSEILKAEGEKISKILSAEGEKEAQILKAEGEKLSQILKAEGYSTALEKIFQVARSIDDKTMSLQYLEALKTLGISQSTKFVIPLEFLSLFSGISSSTKQSFTKDKT
ncbi:MAG: SPFH/Band 7/PHB domain protein [Candidatus Calescibacterium sp.]|nr:SPFH/Band 7/PHB domain protein [Candidatus Calescibacterium sp.]MCX7733753.1 SPFH/Band 7/PHB domain protein [bacterium]MDW8086683.1 SPFH domain-containing protein [Candidatus Calescibacterium sp.]